MKRSRIGISEDPHPTEEVIDAAGIITSFAGTITSFPGTITSFPYYWRYFPRWGAKRRRSAIQREESSATHNSEVLSRGDKKENDYEIQHDGIAMASQPERRLPPTSCSNSKNVGAKDQPRKRAARRKTHRELKETMDELSLQNAGLIKDVEQLRKTLEGLKDYNVHLKSQLALCLEEQQDQNMPYIPLPSSSHPNTRRKTGTMTSCDDFKAVMGMGILRKVLGAQL